VIRSRFCANYQMGLSTVALRRLPSSELGLRDYGTGEWEGGEGGCDHVAGITRDDAARIRKVDAASGRRPAA
jgi:hypothetical protein